MGTCKSESGGNHKPAPPVTARRPSHPQHSHSQPQKSHINRHRLTASLHLLSVLRILLPIVSKNQAKSFAVVCLHSLSRNAPGNPHHRSCSWAHTAGIFLLYDRQQATDLIEGRANHSLADSGYLPRGQAAGGSSQTIPCSPTVWRRCRTTSQLPWLVKETKCPMASRQGT